MHAFGNVLFQHLGPLRLGDAGHLEYLGRVEPPAGKAVSRICGGIDESTTHMSDRRIMTAIPRIMASNTGTFPWACDNAVFSILVAAPSPEARFTPAYCVVYTTVLAKLLSIDCPWPCPWGIWLGAMPIPPAWCWCCCIGVAGGSMPPCPWL